MKTFFALQGGALAIAMICLVGGCGQNEQEQWLAAERQAAQANTSDAFSAAADLYYQLYEQHPTTVRSRQALFKSAQMLLTAQKPTQAFQRFEELVARYPDSDEAAQALFMMAYIQHNYLGDTTKAHILYARFLDRYPTHALAPSAQFEISHLGQSADQLLLPDSAVTIVPNHISVSTASQ